MNSKNKIIKPKQTTKLQSSPEIHPKTPIVSSKVYTTHQHLLAQSPKSNINNLKKPSPTPQRQSIIANPKLIPQAQIFSNSDSELQGSEIQKQQLLQLEIKHLKRENNFLKKKLQELNAEQQAYYPKKRTVPKNKGYQPPNIESLHLNVKYFFKEINNLLSSITKLFKLNIEEEAKFASPKVLENQECPLQREFIFKKYVLNRKLQKIALVDQQKKYPQLLQIFTQYYRYKQQAQRKILQNLDSMILKTNQLNKWLLQKAQIKKLRSEVYSISQKDRITTPEKGFTYQFLKIPENHTNRMTFSPAAKHTHTYKRNSDLSP